MLTVMMINRDILKTGGFWYKPHRGSLDDSMRELRRFEDLDDLFEWVAKSFGIGKDRLYLSGDSVWDERIGADLHYVGISMEKHHVPQCIGHAFWKFDPEILGKYPERS